MYSIRQCHYVPGKNSEAGPADYIQGKAAQKSTKDYVSWLHLWPCLFPYWCGASRTIRDCWKAWDIASPRAAAPATLLRGKAGMKMKEWIEMILLFVIPKNLRELYVWPIFQKMLMWMSSNRLFWTAADTESSTTGVGKLRHACHT